MTVYPKLCQLFVLGRLARRGCHGRAKENPLSSTEACILHYPLTRTYNLVSAIHYPPTN